MNDIEKFFEESLKYDNLWINFDKITKYEFNTDNQEFFITNLKKYKNDIKNIIIYSFIIHDIVYDNFLELLIKGLSDFQNLIQFLCK
jgi:hypothetical protein